MANIYGAWDLDKSLLVAIGDEANINSFINAQHSDNIVLWQSDNNPIVQVVSDLGYFINKLGAELEYAEYILEGNDGIIIADYAEINSVLA